MMVHKELKSLLMGRLVMGRFVKGHLVMGRFVKDVL